MIFMSCINLGKTKCNINEDQDVKGAFATTNGLRLHYSKMSYCGNTERRSCERQPWSQNTHSRALWPWSNLFVFNNSSGVGGGRGVTRAVRAGRPTETTLTVGDWFAKRGSNPTQHLLRDVFRGGGAGRTGPGGGMFCV